MIIPWEVKTYFLGQKPIKHLLFYLNNNKERCGFMIHYIYCYINKKNGKKYIGQTNNLERRKKQHIQDSIHCHKGHENSYNLPFHCAIRKYGIDNFEYKILEIIDTEDWNKVNLLEAKYIKKENSLAPNGYNLQCQGKVNKGKNKSKISEDDIQEIITALKNNEYIPNIAEKYQLSRSYISDINNGRCLKQENEKYPLQQNRIRAEEYLQIIDLLKNTRYSIREIARYMNRNRDTIEKINKGYQQIVRFLYGGSFPIRENARRGYVLKPVETISGETESTITIDT